MATKSKSSTKAKTKKTGTKKVSTKSEVTKVSKSNKNWLGSLKNWNVTLAIMFLLQAIAIFLIGKAVTVPIVNHYLAKDALASDSAGRTVLAPAVRTLFNIDIRYIIVAFLLISAIYYGLIATARRKQYEAGLQNKTNKMRWVQQTLTVGLMLILVGLLNGVYDAATLVAVFVLVGLIYSLSYFGEVKVAEWRNKLQLFALVCVAGATVWLIIAASLKGAIFYGQGLSAYVYGIDAIILLATLGLAYNKWQIMHAKGRWSDYLFGERMYVILGFLAQTLLAWLVLAGFLS